MRPVQGVRRIRLASSLILVIGLIACGGVEGSSPATPTTASDAGAPTAPAVHTPASSASTTTPPGATPDPGAVVVDPDLLTHLPVAVAGAALLADPVSAGRIAADPSLGGSASAIAVALVVVASDDDEDLAISSVVRLRPGVYSDAFFVEWRASYDEAACAPAGGATSDVARTIAGFDAFVGGCAGGVTTYHVHLPAAGVLVSITSVGAGDLGALVVAGLR